MALPAIAIKIESSRCIPVGVNDYMTKPANVENYIAL